MPYLRSIAATVTVAGLTAANLLGFATNAEAKPLPNALTVDGTTFKVRPQRIVYTGDGSGFVGRNRAVNRGGIIWVSWTQKMARGRGAIWLNNCTPSCGNGRYLRHRGKIVLSNPRNGHFTTLKVKILGMPTDTRTLRRPSWFYTWALN